MPATVATRRGPTRSSQSPPMTVPTPRNMTDNVKVSETRNSVQCSAAINGLTKTLHPYTAPRQSCIITAAAAIPQRFARRSVAMAILHFLKQGQLGSPARQRRSIANSPRGAEFFQRQLLIPGAFCFRTAPTPPPNLRYRHSSIHRFPAAPLSKRHAAPERRPAARPPSR